MFRPQPVDYLLIGHVAVDLTPQGKQLCGTVSYAALAAKAMGLRVGIVTSAGEDAPLHHLDGIQIVNIPTETSTVCSRMSKPSADANRLCIIALH
jgi:hypothetical protein